MEVSEAGVVVVEPMTDPAASDATGQAVTIASSVTLTEEVIDMILEDDDKPVHKVEEATNETTESTTTNTIEPTAPTTEPTAPLSQGKEVRKTPRE